MSGPTTPWRTRPSSSRSYATLTAWGMHRMGPGGAKLVDFPVMRESLRGYASEIRSLASMAITSLPGEQVESVTQRLWQIVSGLRIGVGDTRIVAGSKALHHLLPELLPPIDREYTIRFFFHTTTLYQGEDLVFRTIFPLFHSIGTRCRDGILARIGQGMHTS